MPLIAKDIDEFLAKMHWHAKHIQTHLTYHEPEQRTLLYLSLAFLSDSYVSMAEEYLKQGKAFESSYFAAKAQFIRNVGFETFGEFAERDYHTGLYKMPKDVVIHTPAEQIQQVAQFCSQNIKPDEKLLSSPKALGDEIGRQLKKAPAAGAYAKLFGVLWKRFKELKEKPTKWGDVYELLLLAENVKEVSAVLSKGETKERRGPEKRGKAGLEGFRL